MLYLLGNPIRPMTSYARTDPRVGVYRYLRMHSYSQCWPVCPPQRFLIIRRWTHNYCYMDQAMGVWIATPGALRRPGNHHACHSVFDMIHP